VAGLHADSWRCHYRGAYADSFLDGDVLADRLSVWSERLYAADPRSRTILGEHDCELVAFAHIVLDEDESWGTLIDNLHVVSHLKGRGIGTRLLAISAQIVLGSAQAPAIYLWVLEQNSPAWAFYKAHGGVCARRDIARPPGGDPLRLHGQPESLLYCWPDAAALLGSPDAAAAQLS
jgi:ribosomal protein S18 acetylase RimI-like enzyme